MLSIQVDGADLNQASELSYDLALSQGQSQMPLSVQIFGQSLRRKVQFWHGCQVN